jgi:hypothetical protein
MPALRITTMASLPEVRVLNLQRYLEVSVTSNRRDKKSLSDREQSPLDRTQDFR